MKERIIQIMAILTEIEQALELDLSDETIFQEACSIFRGEKAGENRQAYNYPSKKIVNEPISEKPDEKPTQAQLDLMDKMKIKVDNIEKLTKKEVSKLIDDKIKSRRDNRK